MRVLTQWLLHSECSVEVKCRSTYNHSLCVPASVGYKVDQAGCLPLKNSETLQVCREGISSSTWVAKITHIISNELCLIARRKVCLNGSGSATLQVTGMNQVLCPCQTEK